MKISKRRLFDRSVTVGAVTAIGIAVIVAILYANSRLNPIPHTLGSIVASQHKEPFPAVDAATLTTQQQKIIALLRAEYQAQPSGTKYSQGVSEPWCADFVSWIMKETGQPLINPHSGSWRIPGTYTLGDYYRSVGRFRSATSGYQPQVGDVMLYDNPSPFGQHVNIVVKNNKDIVTTVGGNENGGIRVFTHTHKDDVGFIGYGILDQSN